MFEKPGGEWHHINRGMYWERYGEYNKAVACYSRALRTDPHHATANHRLGLTLYNLGVFQKSLKHLDRALESNADNVDVLLSRGRVLEKLHRYDDALKCLTSIGPDHAAYFEAMTVTASCRSGLGMHQEAVRMLDQVLAAKPGDPDVLYVKSRILGRMNRTSESVSCLNKAIGADSLRSVEIYEQGHRLTQAGKHEEAIGLYSRALEIDPKNTKALIAKAWTLDLAGFPTKDVFPYLDRALEVDPGNTEALMTRGLICDRKGLFDKAVECFDAILESHPDHVRALYSKGVSLYSMKKHGPARFFCQSALLREPDNIMALCTMVWLLDHESEYEEALKYCDRVLDLNPRSVYATSYKAKILMSLGKYDDALKHYDGALELDPNNKRAQYHRGRVQDILDGKKRSIFGVFR